MTVAVRNITVREIAEAAGVSERSIQRRAAKEKWDFLEAPGKGRGGKVRMYRMNFLPDEIQADIMKAEATLLYKDGSDIVPVGSPELTDRQNKIALARADLVRAYLAEKKRAKSKKHSVGKSAKSFIAGYNTGLLLPNIFKVLGKTAVKTVETWVRTFRKNNYDYTVLATNYGNRKGQRKVTQDEINTALSFCLHPNRLRIAEAVRLTRIALRRRQIPSPSSDATIRRVIEDWKKTHYDRWVFCREGKKALNDKVLPYINRDAGLLEVGDVLVADGHVLNFEVLHPFTGKPCRMDLVLWYDWASRHPAGWEIMPTENVQCIAAGLRRAILNLGKVPKVAYLDNGRAFKAKIFTSKEIDFEEAGFYGMFARLGIETVFAWTYHGQSKVIERFFGTFNELERLMPTYTGASIADKPARMMRNEKLHRKMHEKRHGGWVPTIDQANQILSSWFDDYDRRPHRGLSGICPIEIWESGKGPGVDPEALVYLMMSMEILTVHRNGVTFMGRHYYDEALYGLRDRVMIRYDMEDLSRVYVFDKTGARKICTAKSVQGVHPMARILGTKEDQALLKHEIKKKHRLKKETEMDARRFVEDAPALIEIPMQAESLKGKAESKVLPRGEAERIEAEAAKMEVIAFTPKAPEPLYMSEPDRYEALLERECKGEELAIDDMQFMRYFEKTELYQDLKDRFEMLREYWIAGPETVDVVI